MQDVGDVHQTARSVVDEVLALARTVHAACDRDLGEVDGQRVIGVVEDEGDLGEADGIACRGAREDDVLHRLAAQLLGALLAQDPQDGVGDVGLAAAVGAHDHGQAGIEDHGGLIGEGFEPLQGERLQIHGAAPFSSWPKSDSDASASPSGAGRQPK